MIKCPFGYVSIYMQSLEGALRRLERVARRRPLPSPLQHLADVLQLAVDGVTAAVARGMLYACVVVRYTTNLKAGTRRAAPIDQWLGPFDRVHREDGTIGNEIISDYVYTSALRCAATMEGIRCYVVVKLCTRKHHTQAAAVARQGVREGQRSGWPHGAHHSTRERREESAEPERRVRRRFTVREPAVEAVGETRPRSPGVLL